MWKIHNWHLLNQVEREAAKKQEELFAMEKLNDALNEKLKSLSMEVCTVTLLINEFEGTIDLRTLCTRPFPQY